jgi:large repetitive protein
VSAIFTDADGDAITLNTEATSTPGTLPTWITFSGGVYTISTSVISNEEITLTATDIHGGTNSEKFNVTIYNTTPTVNTSPNYSGVNDTAISHVVDLTTVFADPEVTSGYQSYSFIVANLPTFLTYSVSGTELTITGTPTTGDTGSYSIDLTANDGYASATSVFTVQISLNTPPYVTNVQNIQTLENQLTTFDMNSFGFIDDEGDILSYTMKFSNGTTFDSAPWIIFDNSTMQLNITPPSSSSASMLTTIYVEDPYHTTVGVPFVILVDFIPKINPLVTEKSGNFFSKYSNQLL